MVQKTPRRLCKAHTKRGPCKHSPIHGGVVCQTHGGSAPQVKKKAQERLADLIDPNRALREAARLAYSDIRELYDDHGRLKPMKDWPDGIAAAVAGLENVRGNLDKADGKTDAIVRLKLTNKVPALEMLFKHMGLLVDKVEVKIEGDLLARLAAGRERVAKGGK